MQIFGDRRQVRRFPVAQRGRGEQPATKGQAHVGPALAAAAEQLDAAATALGRLVGELDGVSVQEDPQATRMVENLTAPARQLRVEVAELTRRLEAVRQALGVSGGERPPRQDVTGSEHPAGGDRQKPKPEAERPPAAEETAPPGTPPSEGVRLLVSQMSLEGNSHEQIAARLRKLRIADAEAVVDHVLGPDAR